MTERTSYAPGTPSWVDLGTPDIDAAVAFYGGLFGWRIEEGWQMTEQENGVRSNRVLLAGGVLAGIGGLLGCVGALLVSSAVVSASRRWVQQLDAPPSAMAKAKWQQARAATTAGARAWRNGPSS
mgnify:CR=1 FL=1